MKRRTLIKTLTAAGLLTGAGVPGLLVEALANGKLPIAAGLHKLVGRVSVNGLPAREGMLIKPGDTVVTGPGAQAIYVIGNNAFLQRGDSSVSFGDNTAAFLRVVTGQLLSVFGHGQKRIEVSTATIGIRGTACYIESEPNRTYFCLCYGEAEITPTAAPDQREVIRTTHHDHPIMIFNDPNQSNSMAPVGVKNHHDAELVMLEDLVGRKPPFEGQGGTEY